MKCIASVLALLTGLGGRALAENPGGATDQVASPALAGCTFTELKLNPKVVESDFKLALPHEAGFRTNKNESRPILRSQWHVTKCLISKLKIASGSSQEKPSHDSKSTRDFLNKILLETYVADERASVSLEDCEEDLKLRKYRERLATDRNMSNSNVRSWTIDRRMNVANEQVLKCAKPVLEAAFEHRVIRGVALDIAKDLAEMKLFDGRFRGRDSLSPEILNWNRYWAVKDLAMRTALESSRQSVDSALDTNSTEKTTGK